MIFISPKYLSTYLLRLFLVGQVSFCIYMLLTGKKGYRDLQKIHYQIAQLQQEIQGKKNQIEEVKREIQEWKESLFLPEKYAREKLHMGKKDEKVFFYE